ncbi:DUF7504 family protein [Halorussus halophilus]|uniref:DUF7504 family protein n=1 Tax=Halorussus halophilus TaxID=2650975 RepID=UPI001300CAF9|nr:hypothetical protein [Halorussus halophilus]
MRETTDSVSSLALSPGEQALVSVPSMQSPLSALPAEAFDNLLVVSATTSPKKVEQLVVRRGGNPATVGVIPVTGSPSEYDGPLWTTDPVDPSDLTGISIRLSEALQYVTKEGWVVFDNVNVLLMYAAEKSVYRLLDSVISTVRGKKARGAYCLVRDAVTDETYAQLSGLCDVAVQQE